MILLNWITLDVPCCMVKAMIDGLTSLLHWLLLQMEGYLLQLYNKTNNLVVVDSDVTY